MLSSHSSFIPLFTPLPPHRDHESVIGLEDLRVLGLMVLGHHHKLSGSLVHGARRVLLLLLLALGVGQVNTGREANEVQTTCAGYPYGFG